MDNPTFAELLRNWRESQGFSQTQAGAALGTSQGAISTMETGAVIPSLPVLDRYARAMGLPVAVLRRAMGFSHVAAAAE